MGTQEEIAARHAMMVADGVNIDAPPLFMLVEPDESSELLMKPSFYAESAKAAGIDLITWSLERTGPGLKGYYWSSLDSLDLVDGDKMVLLYVLGIEIGVLGVFSDWPAT